MSGTAEPKMSSLTAGNSTRSMILAAAGALVGLVIAGTSLFSARGTATRTVPPDSIALVNQRPILRSDFITQLESETGDTFAHATRAQQLKVLDEMVREELLVQRGLELDFGETDQPTRNGLTTAMTQQALSEAVTSMPSEEQLRRYYDEHRSRYLSEGVLVLRQWRMARRDGEGDAALLTRAAELVAAVRAGHGESIAAHNGASELPSAGEQFYFAARAQLGDALFETVAALGAGSVAEPRLDQQGARVVEVLQNRLPAPLPFERTQPEVLNDYKTEQQNRLMEATIKFLLERAAILIASDYAHDYPK